MMLKLFLKQVFVFLLVLSIVNVLLFFLISGFYIKDYEEVDLNYSEFLLADSHGTPLGDFTEIHDVHNFSSQSDSYLDMERKLQFLIRNTKVHRVYISVDDHTLSTTREDQNNLDRSSFYTDQNDFPSYRAYFFNKYLKYYCIFLNDRYSLIIKNFLQDELFDYSKWGGVRSKAAWEDLNIPEQEKQSLDRIENYFVDSIPSKEMTMALERIIKICKLNKIDLVGLKFPLSKTYYGMLGEESYGADSLFIRNKLIVVDFDDLFLEQDSLFRDMDHLDRDGGEIFADILFDSLENVLK
ncbi:hypothetical protein MM236_11985 [Belliella sp. DSM 107340]|uniref:Uncharacterized protein n=1 Tax=Belliella calami TaxID=2923436 RepID=A0ABS9UQ07_9BACT|nr:hypothetical protein [Belliella calami]MCH7398714.1 hypothetical protein [Belliella calami]